MKQVDFIHLIGRANEEIGGSVDCFVNMSEVVSFWFDFYNDHDIAVVKVKGYGRRNDGTIGQRYDTFYSNSISYLKTLIK